MLIRLYGCGVKNDYSRSSIEVGTGLKNGFGQLKDGANHFKLLMS